MSKKISVLLSSFVILFSMFGLSSCMNPASKTDASASTVEAPQIGEKAPDFEAIDSNGKKHKLSDFLGKYVVLEWTNHRCPFVIKHYTRGNMQRLQKKYTEQGVVWLSIISSASGKQGNISGYEANQLTEARHAKPTAVLLDQGGKIGKLYQAKTTPHMFVIDNTGTLVYQGAIDSINSVDAKDIPDATNYIDTTFTQLFSGEKVQITETKPYGCSVKY